MSGQIEGIFFDDVGSFPLPKGVRLKSLSREQYLDLVRDVLAQKSRAGVEVPTYPQFRDMIRMFMDDIENPAYAESPYLIKKEYARIMELEVTQTRKSRPGRALHLRIRGHSLPGYSQ